ncbi:DNA N-6-adenine-methyltransferase [Anaerotruncus colihominis]|uniref:DNA N-6-adenine-methyltransferase (Dam) n=2 Tax=Anaerotruncus colihominis TaxID=169435 RepID=B0PEW6_9FIRM|nr:DNA N-6-adenine-methyltransferase [Anaerotruncus colihominis]EDS09899.1 DNA N-6-adenine-methyltransferase (Dam) [Anaerotruncus colihominis DSM 17241]UWN73951.1 phage N-6-adenine-methyltransferase [Anaerotruncus colihominis]CUQ03552.1 phage N-6-adenine-methyltransferase [Anaerotruncus colihominis]
MNKALLSSKRLDWCTPRDFFDALDVEFHFTLDAAATEKSAKCAKYYTPETDGLSASWAGETVFCNPPYGREIKAWIKKGFEEGQQSGTTVVLLIPSRTDTEYFHKYILGKAEIRFLKGRLKFTDEEGLTQDAAPFPSMLVIYRGQGKEQNDG